MRTYTQNPLKAEAHQIWPKEQWHMRCWSIGLTERDAREAGLPDRIVYELMYEESRYFRKRAEKYRYETYAIQMKLKKVNFFFKLEKDERIEGNFNVEDLYKQWDEEDNMLYAKAMTR